MPLSSMKVITIYLSLPGQGQEKWRFIHHHFCPSELFSSLWRSGFSVLWTNHKPTSLFYCEWGGQSNSFSSCCRQRQGSSLSRRVEVSPFPPDEWELWRFTREKTSSVTLQEVASGESFILRQQPSGMMLAISLPLSSGPWQLPRMPSPLPFC